MIHTARVTITTKGKGDAHDITAHVASAVRASKQRRGVATAFLVVSTAVITTIECEPGAIADLNGVLERLAPRQGDYRHHERWGDDNGSSPGRAAPMGPALAGQSGK